MNKTWKTEQASGFRTKTFVIGGELGHATSIFSLSSCAACSFATISCFMALLSCSLSWNACLSASLAMPINLDMAVSMTMLRTHFEPFRRTCRHGCGCVSHNVVLHGFFHLVWLIFCVLLCGSIVVHGPGNAYLAKRTCLRDLQPLFNAHFAERMPAWSHSWYDHDLQQTRSRYISGHSIPRVCANVATA
jgi:hypothetical protein